MAQLNVFRRLALPALIHGLTGSMMLCQEQARAQAMESAQLAPNEQVIQSWQQSNLGAPAPVLSRDEDGNTRIEWKGSNTFDAYSNDIRSSGGSFNTPLKTGTFFRNSLSSDLRAIHRDNAVDFFQLGLTNTDDRSVLSQSRYQVNNLQFGRTGETYMIAAGDIAPNFSSLSSALGARGFFGQKQFNDITASGFAGVVAESWETLTNHVPRSQYLKDVNGIKLEKAFGTSLRTYVTTQNSSEREPDRNQLPAFFAPRGKSRSFSGGFQYQKDQLGITGESAGSRFEDGGNADRKGRGTIVDATWRNEAVGLRGGYHDITNGFTSLSLAAQAGIREAYTGLDWTAASWITLSGDVRRSRSTTLPTPGFASTYIDTDSGSARANINFGPDHPGWSVALQQAMAHAVNNAGQASHNRDFSSTLNYSTPAWNAGLGIGRGKVVSEVSPSSDSLNSNWSLNLGRNFSDGLPDLPQTWSAAVNLSANGQKQRLLAGGETTNTNYTVTLTGQRGGWGTLNLLLTSGEVTQPMGGPSLRLRAFQLEAVYPIKGQSSIKAYVRNTRRNIDDPVLSSTEKTAGIQLVHAF